MLSAAPFLLDPVVSLVVKFWSILKNYVYDIRASSKNPIASYPIDETFGKEDEDLALEQIRTLASKWPPSENCKAITLLRWSGSCIGDDANIIKQQSLRIVAFQTANKTGDLKLWVQQMAGHLRTMGAHFGIFTATRIHGNDRRTMVVNTFLEHGFLALSHTPAQPRKALQPSAKEDDLMGLKADAVILALMAEFGGGWTDITNDTDGRAIDANVCLGDDSTVRMNATYGVSGACCPNFASCINKSIAEVKLSDYMIT